MSAPGQAPAPPPGPGVQPPFVAPPTDGAKQRRWLAIGLAGAMALVCCVGGLFGLGGVVVLGGQAIIEQAKSAVTEFLTAVQQENYERAYRLLCDQQQARTSESEFASSFALSPGITSFTVGEPAINDDVQVPASVRYSDGTAETQRYLLIQDSETGDFEVCGRR